eukprot:319834_1
MRSERPRWREAVNPLEFLINPESYSETIENIFDLSFVVKEGCGQILIDNETKQPVLSYVPKSERKRRLLSMDGAVDNQQCFVKFNPRTFCNLIDVYGITESQIHMEDTNARIKGLYSIGLVGSSCHVEL